MNYLVSKRIPNAETFLEHCERINMKSKSVLFRQGELSQDFYAIRQRYPDVLYALTSQIGQRLKNTTRKLADLTFIDVYGRIHRSLIQLTTLPEAMTHPDGMQVRVTRQELGKLVGCSREMAGRVLKMLTGDGYITVAGKTIVVLREPRNSAT
jgi:CRP/FNR family cyclic AMP-dependent transcriptional regulator